MDDDYVQQSIADAHEVGRDNADMLELAEHWCQHARRDRGPMGVGMIERQTGLPVSGGRLTCDYTRRPTAFGASLRYLALEFYEGNCVGCEYRRSGGLFKNHLGTWAERTQEAMKEAAERDQRQMAEAERQRAQRRDVRTAVLGSSDAQSRAIGTLMNRIDSAEPDRGAMDELVAHATLNPHAFTAEIASVLLSDAATCGEPAYLKAVWIAHQSTGVGSVADLLAAARKGVTQGWGHVEGCEILGQYATAQDADDGILRVAAAMAAPEMVPLVSLDEIKTRPGLLLRLLEVAPETVVWFLGNELRCGDDSRRSHAAGVISVLTSQGHRDPAFALLPALLDALKQKDDRHYYGRASSVAQKAVASLLQEEPDTVNAAIEERWAAASLDYRGKLFACYDSATRGRLNEDLPSAVATVVARKAISCLQDSSLDLVRRASDTLELVSRYHGTSVDIRIDVLMGALAVACDEADRCDARMNQATSTIVLPGRPPSLEPMEAYARASVRRRVSSDLTKACSELAIRDLMSFWETWDRLWGACDEDSRLRLALVELAGRLARSRTTIGQALPRLYGGILGQDVMVRKAGLVAVAQIPLFEGETLPEAVTVAVLAGLADDHLAVIAAAAEAVRVVRLDAQEVQRALYYLVRFVQYCAPDRDRERQVREAIQSAVVLATRTPLEEQVNRLMLEQIERMPAQAGAEALHRLRRVEKAPEWSGTAVRVLRLDNDPEYAQLGEDDRDYLLARLACRPPAEIAEHEERLVDLATSRRHDLDWAWRIADILSVAGCLDAAVQVASGVLESIPTTIEHRPRRLVCIQVACAHRYEQAIAAGDTDAACQIANEWVEAEEEEARSNAR